MSNRLKLKKYTNRRLYDTEKSAYVTLNEVAEMIRNGRLVEVSDAKTGEDVTAFILTQVVLEHAKQKNALLPVPLLHLIIRYGDTLLAEFFEKHLQQTLEIYLSQKKIFDEQFQRWFQLGMRFNPNAPEAPEILNPFQAFFKAFSKTSASDPENGNPRT